MSVSNFHITFSRGGAVVVKQLVKCRQGSNVQENLKWFFQLLETFKNMAA